MRGLIGLLSIEPKNKCKIPPHPGPLPPWKNCTVRKSFARARGDNRKTLAASFAPGEPDAARSSFGDVVLVGRLQDAIQRLNPSIPEEGQGEALRKVLRLDSPSLIGNNRAFHKMLRDGVSSRSAGRSCENGPAAGGTAVRGLDGGFADLSNLLALRQPNQQCLIGPVRRLAGEVQDFAAEMEIFQSGKDCVHDSAIFFAFHTAGGIDHATTGADKFAGLEQQPRL